MNFKKEVFKEFIYVKKLVFVHISLCLSTVCRLNVIFTTISSQSCEGEHNVMSIYLVVHY